MYEEKTKICPSCRREIDYYELSCSYCNQEQEVIFDNPRAQYIQSNIGTYLRKFYLLEQKNTKIGWNWCGFLFGANWLIYRKLYPQFTIFYFLPTLTIVLALLFAVVVPELGIAMLIISILASLVLWIMGGLFSDYWYKQKIDSLVQEGKELSNEERKTFAKKKGGTSPGLLFLVLAINFLWEILNAIFTLAMAAQ